MPYAIGHMPYAMSHMPYAISHTPYAMRHMPDERAILETFGRFVSPHVVERLLADPAGVHLGGAQQTITVLFADLRGYTALAERLRPEQLLEILNGHLTVAAQAVLAHEGTISQYSGDQIMALFNAPLAQPDHALRATRAAIRIRQATASYHACVPADLQMQFGIGIATGEVVVGNIGASEMLNYTAIGDTVNLAERLQELARGGEILLAETARQALVGEDEPRGVPTGNHATLRIPEGHNLSDRGAMWIRGRREPVQVYALEELGFDEGGSPSLRSRAGMAPALQRAER